MPAKKHFHLVFALQPRPLSDSGVDVCRDITWHHRCHSQHTLACARSRRPRRSSTGASRQPAWPCAAPHAAPHTASAIAVWRPRGCMDGGGFDHHHPDAMPHSAHPPACLRHAHRGCQRTFSSFTWCHAPVDPCFTVCHQRLRPQMYLLMHEAAPQKKLVTSTCP